MSELKKSYEKELRKLASADDAEGYGRWLSTQSKAYKKAADVARTSAASQAVRELADYGASGEALSRSGLADDGYADYLRRAAKEAREARIGAIESERAGGEREALAGYADYLNEVRRADGDRLVKAAEELLKLKSENTARIDRIIGDATESADAAALLRKIREDYEYIPSDSSAADLPSVITRIRTMGYNRDRAYRYCKLLGYSDERAGEVADFATEDYADIADRLSALFGD